MKETLIVLLTSVSFLFGVLGSAQAFEKKVALGENLGATW